MEANNNTGSLAAEIEHLSRLKATGVINEAEFEELKAKIIRAEKPVQVPQHLSPEPANRKGAISGHLTRGLWAAPFVLVAYFALQNPDTWKALSEAIGQVETVQTGPDLLVQSQLSEGCQQSPFAPGCPQFAIRITNRGPALQLQRVVINRRENNRNCVLNIGKHLDTGDTWSGDYDPGCGSELVHAAISTDKGSATYGSKDNK